MSESVRYERRGSVGFMIVDNPPVNAMSQAVREGLIAALKTGLADRDACALVLVGGGRTFIAGADIAEFGKPFVGPNGRDIVEAYEASSKPLIAAIHGTAFGGGLETALGCHYRIALASAQVGLPEVKLGLLPGGGGTQRLPRLVGAEAALEMITSGAPISAAKAQALGIVDAVVDGDIEVAAQGFAENLDPTPKLPRVRDREPAQASPEVFAAKRRALETQARGQFAPQRCVDAVEAAFTLPFDAGMARERDLFIECLRHEQSQALIHAFFAERQVAKIPDIDRDTPVRAIQSVGVVGAGTMGGGIAMCFANVGIPVTLLDVDEAAVQRGLGVIAKNYASSVQRGRLTAEERDRRLGLIGPTTSFADFATVDLVIEAVFEEMPIKEATFRKLAAVCKAGCILASNTSTLDIDRIAAATKCPEDVIGMHFFSPANVMRLLEVVRGARTAKDVIATALAVGRRIGKVAVLVGNCDGFVGNRMLQVYGTEVQRVVEEGASPEQVDAAMLEFGLAMGPFAQSDLAGNDVGWRIRQRCLAEGKTYGSPLLDRIHELGRLGQKTNAGWYRYEAGSRTPIPDPAVRTMIDDYRRERGIEPRAIANEEIVKRLIYSLVNEGARILEEGIALRAGDIDIIYLNGYGFPAWRGGPMKYAELVGLEKVLADIRAFHARFGESWKPAPLLETLVARRQTFADLERGKATTPATDNTTPRKAAGAAR